MRFLRTFFSRLQKKGDVFEPFKVDPFGIHVFVLAYKQRTCFRCVVFQDFDLPILMWTFFWAGAWSNEKKMQHIKLSNMILLYYSFFCLFWCLQPPVRTLVDLLELAAQRRDSPLDVFLKPTPSWYQNLDVSGWFRAFWEWHIYLHVS